MPTPRPSSLREAHAHLPWHGLALSMLNLSACTGVEHCLQLVATEADRLRRANDPGWLLASGARVAAWQSDAGPRWPTREELDRITDRPCALMSFDHHALAANTAAMRAAGLNDDPHHTPDPLAGVITRDPRTGLPTGLLLESAAQQVWSAAPEPTPAQRTTQLRAALDDLASHGFTEVHDLLSPPWLGPALAALHDAGQLPLRVEIFCPFEDLDRAVRTAPAWARPTLRLAGTKVFADGTLNSRTAWMLHPYKDPLPDLPTGKALMDAHSIAHALERSAAHHLTLAVHAIGDAATRATLDAFDLVTASSLSNSGARASRPATSPSLASSSNPPPLLRIEHAELIDEADIPRFARPGLIASLQPCHLLADIEALERFLPHRLHRVLPIRDLLTAGLTPGHSLLFGSDVPVVRADPADSITAATLRRRPEMPPSRAIALDQAIDEATAWACFRKA